MSIYEEEEQSFGTSLQVKENMGATLAPPWLAYPPATRVYTHWSLYASGMSVLYIFLIGVDFEANAHLKLFMRTGRRRIYDCMVSTRT